MMVKILQCSCEHAYQDEKYGKKMRVHNSRVKQDEYRCTVCGTVRKSTSS